MVIVISLFIFSTASANDETAESNGVATVSGTCDPNDRIEISLPNGELINVTPNSSGHYSTEITGLSVGDTVDVTALNKDGRKSQTIRRTITRADVIQQQHTVTADRNHASVSSKSSQAPQHKKNQNIPWLPVLLLGGAIGSTVAGAAFANSHHLKVKKSIFSLVGSGLLWQSQQNRHTVKLVGKLTNKHTKVKFDMTPHELDTLSATGEVILSQQFTQFEIKVFNRQNSDVKMVLANE